MKNKAFAKLLKQFEKLTFTQSKKAEEYLHNKCAIESIEDTIGTAESCPYCHSDSFHKYGVCVQDYSATGVKSTIRHSIF